MHFTDSQGTQQHFSFIHSLILYLSPGWHPPQTPISTNATSNSFVEKSILPSTKFALSFGYNPGSSISTVNNQRSPVYFADYTKHTYQDLFGLAEFLTNVVIASQLNVLDILEVDEEKFRLMHEIATFSTSSSSSTNGSQNLYSGCNHVIMRFSWKESCSFDRKELITVDNTIIYQSEPSHYSHYGGCNRGSGDGAGIPGG